MGYFLSKLINTYFSEDVRVLMLGLDAAGKTTILYNLKLNEVVHTIPTIGFNAETVEFGRFKLSMWDIGGQEKIRALWRHYFNNCDALIYVVDSADVERMELAAEELRDVLKAPELEDSVVLIMANKQDLPGALTTEQVAQKMGVNQMRKRQWHIQGCCASNGQGLYEGLANMTKMIKNNHKKN